MIGDIVGKKFNKLTVLKEVKIGRKTFCECKCECGEKKYINKTRVKHRLTKSCGCISKELRKQKSLKKYSNTRLYRIWYGIKLRCKNKKNKAYKNYGGRGITYDPKWKTFEGFREDMQDGYKNNLSIDRIDNDGNYCKENCRWATAKEQANNKRNSDIVFYKGKYLTITQLCRKLKINYYLVKSRVRNGWEIEDAVEKPSSKKGQRFLLN